MAIKQELESIPPDESGLLLSLLTLIHKWSTVEGSGWLIENLCIQSHTNFSLFLRSKLAIIVIRHWMVPERSSPDAAHTVSSTRLIHKNRHAHFLLKNESLKFELSIKWFIGRYSTMVTIFKTAGTAQVVMGKHD